MLQEWTASTTRVLCLALMLLLGTTPAWSVGGTWTDTQSLHTSRAGHTASLLPDGTVLVTGGMHDGQAIASTEIYDPDVSSWALSGNLNLARSNASAVVLSNGLAIVAGGCVEDCLSSITPTSELFDSLTGTWTFTGAMTKARIFFGMVPLGDGRVLAAGGCSLYTAGCTRFAATAEIYDPASGTWTLTGPMNVARAKFTLTLLQDGRVLAVGGLNHNGHAVASAEIYDPSTGLWTLTNRMRLVRYLHAAALLSDGTVLVTGGITSTGNSTGSAELYQPTSGKWKGAGSLIAGRFEHTATLLMNGQVLVAGGNRATPKFYRVLTSAELYNPADHTWLRTGKMNHPRAGHTATVLNPGYVLVVGGNGPQQNLSTVEIYTP